MALADVTLYCASGKGTMAGFGYKGLLDYRAQEEVVVARRLGRKERLFSTSCAGQTGSRLYP